MKKIFYLIKILSLICFIANSNSVFAKTIFVNQASSGANNGTSWTNAYKTIEQAISDASSGDIIVVAKGVYKPGNSRTSRYNMKNNVHLIGGFNGDEEFLSQANPFENQTIISGEIGDPNDNTDNIEMLMRFNKIQTATVDGFIFRDAYTTNFIGAIEINSSLPTFRNCTFENNIANGSFSSGGAITISGFDGKCEPYFTSCKFINNFCSVIGGAIHSNNSNCETTLISCLFSNNEANRGGAIHNGGGVVYTYNCTFTNNTARLGSASFTTSGNGTAHRNDIIWNNNHQVGSSATARATSSATVLVNHSIIQGGYAGTDNQNVNPRFINTNNDFSLQENSPARLKGDPNFNYDPYPSRDAAGNRRITYHRIDLGAFEFKCKPQDESINQFKITNCGSYTAPNGTVYNSSGIYKVVYANSNGCDSIMEMDLTIINIDLSVTKNNDILTANENGVTYQWLDCNNGNAPIAGATGKSFSPEKSGNYAVIITKGDCQGTSDCVQFTKNTSSISSISSSQSNWSIYPNPTSSNVINIELFGVSGDISVKNIEGKLIHKEHFTAGKHLLKIPNLKTGVYFVSLNGKTEKLVVF
jgi:hypothetical protein